MSHPIQWTASQKWLLGCNILLSIVLVFAAMNVDFPRKTYVLTPLFQVVPDGSRWTEAEFAALQQRYPVALEARDMASGYAHLGSTLNVDDLLRGIASLQTSPYLLSAKQSEVLTEKINVLQSDRRQIREVQAELIQLENGLAARAKKWGIYE